MTCEGHEFRLMPVWDVPRAGGTMLDIVSLSRTVYSHEVFLRSLVVGKYHPFPYDDALAWCTEYFGQESPKLEVGFDHGHWIHFGPLFMFKNRDHAFEFKVRWG